MLGCNTLTLPFTAIFAAWLFKSCTWYSMLSESPLLVGYKVDTSQAHTKHLSLPSNGMDRHKAGTQDLRSRTMTVLVTAVCAHSAMWSLTRQASPKQDVWNLP